LSEQVFDVRGALGALREQRRVVVVCVLVGVLAAAAFSFLRPPAYSATALVLVPQTANSAQTSSGGAPPANSNATDTEIATSAAVLSDAGSRVNPHLSFLATKRRVTATAVAANLVQVTALGPTTGQAEALANAVATRLVDFVINSNASAGTNALSGLRAEAAQLTSQVNTYDKEIHSLQAKIASGQSSADSQDAQLLGSLTSAQANEALQLETVNTQIASAQLGNDAANGGTQILQYATTALPPSPLERLLPLVIGAVIGAVLGAGIVLVRVRRRGPKLTSRDQIAEATGAPVLLSMLVGHKFKVSEWLKLLREESPPSSELWSVNRALNCLDVPEHGQPMLTVITFAGDVASVSAVAHVALATSAMEIPTALFLTCDDAASRALSKAYDEVSLRRDELPVNLNISKGSPSIESADSALTVISVVVDPDNPRLPAYVARGNVVLAISAGTSNLEQLTRVMVAISREGLSVKGVIVTNPAREDRTSGASPQSNDHVTRFLQRSSSGLLSKNA